MEMDENYDHCPNVTLKGWKEGCTKMKETIRNNGKITVLGLQLLMKKNLNMSN
jgi:hypothetical protein